MSRAEFNTCRRVGEFYLCSETDTHIFAAADNGFRRSDNDFTISYVWPFDPLTLTPGLDTKLFSDILKKNLTRLANNTRHNIPLEIALQAVGANVAIPVDLNSLLDGHHYVMVPVMTTVIIIILVGSVIGGVVITRVKGDQRESRHNYYLLKTGNRDYERSRKKQGTQTGGR
jgi:hypothetical protein